MSVVGDFTIPAEAFALEHALSTAPEMAVTADRLASHSPKEVFPFLWATGGDEEAFRCGLEADSTVTSVSVADEMADEVLYRLNWCEEFKSLVHDMVDHHAAIIEAQARSDQWRLRLRFANEEMVSSFQTYFRETGHTFEVHQLHHPTEPRQSALGLTADQQETLIAAAEIGYFSVPRAASMDDLADTLGISTNATSERVRRACNTLVHSVLMLDDGMDDQ